MSRAALWMIAAVLTAAPPPAKQYDLIVYGATAGGVITAVSAAREGLDVLLLEPGRHVGGMATGGLSRTDFGNQAVIGGYAREFYKRAGAKYGNDIAWFYEPHVGEAVFREMLGEAKVEVRFSERLRGQNGVAKQGATVTAITTERATYRARIFADCSYEGDLMAQAGVSFTWGRESTAEYGESLAGVHERTPFHQFLVPVSARDRAGKLLPEVGAGPRGAPGSADRKVQSYNFRLILSDDRANQAPIPEPAAYNPRRYELLLRLLKATTAKLARAPSLSQLIFIGDIPNHKADINNNGAFSTDYIGASWDYPNASYARRAEIRQAHIDYTEGFFYFLAHDQRVPKPLRDEVNRWGLAKDEFADTDHWPRQLYIREARRMTGSFVMTQRDLQTELTKPDPIGMGSYNSDSHNVQRFANAEGFAENEGDVQVPVQPYQIPYRVMTPKRTEATNLLVPVCFSASHVAYSSLRMEPQYMIIGQAAGVAATLALREGKAVEDIDTRRLSDRLKQQGAVIEYHQRAATPAAFVPRLWDTVTRWMTN